MADVPLLLVVFALVGAGLNVLRGLSNRQTGEKVSLQAIGGAVILAVLGSLAAVQVLDISTVAGPVALAITGLLVGFTSDFTVKKLV